MTKNISWKNVSQSASLSRLSNKKICFPKTSQGIFYKCLLKKSILRMSRLLITSFVNPFWIIISIATDTYGLGRDNKSRPIGPWFIQLGAGLSRYRSWIWDAGAFFFEVVSLCAKISSHIFCTTCLGNWSVLLISLRRKRVRERESQEKLSVSRIWK